MSKLDLSKPVQTRDGRKARIVCTDRHGDHPVIALVEDEDIEIVRSYTSDGLYCHRWADPSAEDLINAPAETVEYWEVIRSDSGSIWVQPSFKSDWQPHNHRVCLQQVTLVDGKVTKVELV